MLRLRSRVLPGRRRLNVVQAMRRWHDFLGRRLHLQRWLRRRHVSGWLCLHRLPGRAVFRGWGFGQLHLLSRWLLRGYHGECEGRTRQSFGYSDFSYSSLAICIPDISPRLCHFLMKYTCRLSCAPSFLFLLRCLNSQRRPRQARAPCHLPVLTSPPRVRLPWLPVLRVNIRRPQRLSAAYAPRATSALPARPRVTAPAPLVLCRCRACSTCLPKKFISPLMKEMCFRAPCVLHVFTRSLLARIMSDLEVSRIILHLDLLVW